MEARISTRLHSLHAAVVDRNEDDGDDDNYSQDYYSLHAVQNFW
jgi:hypothetical protein